MRALAIRRGERLEFIDRIVKVLGNPLGKPSSATSQGWDAWAEEAKSDHPILYYILEKLIPDIVHTWNVWVTTPFYNIKCKYFTKYHHIKIDIERFFPREPGESKLAMYHWYDKDSLMLYGMFQLLVDYIEHESNIIDWTSDPQHEEVYSEMIDLYKWWIEIRLNREKEYPLPTFEQYGVPSSSLFDSSKYNDPRYMRWSKACEEYHLMEARWHDEDTEMLIRLINIRQNLWS